MFPKVDHLPQAFIVRKLKARRLLMGGRRGYHHGHESAVDMRRLNSWSTYPYLTRLENTASNGQQFKRTMPVEDPGDTAAYTHQQKQILTSSSRVGSFWYDAQKKDGLHGCRPPMDSVWFGSIRRSDSGGHLLGNPRARHGRAGPPGALPGHARVFEYDVLRPLAHLGRLPACGRALTLARASQLGALFRTS